MQKYVKMLKEQHFQVFHIQSEKISSRGEFCDLLPSQSIKKIHIAEFSDVWLMNDLQIGAKKYGWEIQFYPTPAFICSNQELESFFGNKKHYSMAQFYVYQRKNRNILMDNDKPLGGKYSFDTENRKKIPKHLDLPKQPFPQSDSITHAVIKQVEIEFPNAIGSAAPFLYATTHEEAKLALKSFLDDRLMFFGTYQDSIDKDDSFLFHSVLSPMLNIGLLTPDDVVNATLSHCEKHPVTLNCLEGFIRQIMGWREFVKGSYLMNGSKQRSLNYFHHQNKIPMTFWLGQTGIIPIDTLIKRVLKTGFANHIERLMVLGNFLLLTETSPQAIYEWFMANFVDAYDWVMVPNIYGMSQYADGGKIVTKPYISSSNYILKMSNFNKGDWTEIWDGLFWRFIQKHEPLFSSNPRTLNMVHLMKKNQKTILSKIDLAEIWLNQYLKG